MRDEARSVYLKSLTIENLNELRKAKNRLTKSFRNSKKDFYDKYANFKGKAKSVFDAYNHFCKDEKKNEIELDVEQFNAFFATIGSKLAENYNTNNFICKTKLVEHTIFLPEFTTDEVVSAIENLKNSSSVGHDGISNIILKISITVIAPVLTVIFNNCLNKGIFPDNFKKACVLPLLKDGSREDPSNYRPISLLSSMSKVFEKILFKRMWSFCKKFNIISNRQFGFQPKISCMQMTPLFTPLVR